MGLCFPSRRGEGTAIACQYLQKLKNDVGFEMPGHGDLSQWAKQEYYCSTLFDRRKKTFVA